MITYVLRLCVVRNNGCFFGLLAEASQPLGYRDYHALRAYAGVASVTKHSGRRFVVIVRQVESTRILITETS